MKFWFKDKGLVQGVPKENKLGLLSYLGCEMKTPLSLREQATPTFTGPGMGAATARHFLNSVQK